MIFNQLMNPGIYITLPILTLINALVLLRNDCTDWIGVLAGGIWGCVLSLIWYAILISGGDHKYVFYSEVASDNVVCDKPQEQKFKCHVYRNGELISNHMV